MRSFLDSVGTPAICQYSVTKVVPNCIIGLNFLELSALNHDVELQNFVPSQGNGEFHKVISLE